MDPLTGGPCQGIRNSNLALSDLGVKREVVSLDSPLASFLGDDAFPIHAMGPGERIWGYSPKLIPWLIENLGRFDVVIVNGLWQYHSYAVRKALILYKKQIMNNVNKPIPKLFIMPHGMLDPYFQRAPERKLKALRNWIYWKLIEHKVINEAQGLLFTCEEELLLAREPFKPYRPKAELNVGYGIVEPPVHTFEMAQAFFAACPEVGKRPFFLFLSRVHQKKGVDLLIKAYKKVYDKRLNHNDLEFPALVIAGPGLETPYGQQMLDLALEGTQINAPIYFPGMLKGDAKWGAFYMCEAFILPSHQENFGIAVAEALACSKSVLISNQVNIWREIIAAKGGIAADDTLDGTQELLEVWNNLSSDKKIETGKQARYCYEKHFKTRPAAKKLFDAISIIDKITI